MNSFFSTTLLSLSFFSITISAMDDSDINFTEKTFYDANGDEVILKKRNGEDHYCSFRHAKEPINMSAIEKDGSIDDETIKTTPFNPNDLEEDAGRIIFDISGKFFLLNEPESGITRYRIGRKEYTSESPVREPTDGENEPCSDVPMVESSDFMQLIGLYPGGKAFNALYKK